MWECDNKGRKNGRNGGVQSSANYDYAYIDKGRIKASVSRKFHVKTRKFHVNGVKE